MNIKRYFLCLFWITATVIGCVGETEEEVTDITSLWSSDTTQSPSDSGPDTATMFPDLGMPGLEDVISTDVEPEVQEDVNLPSDMVAPMDMEDGDTVVLEEDTQDEIASTDVESVDGIATDTVSESDSLNPIDSDIDEAQDVDASGPAEPIEGTFLLDTTTVLTTENGSPQQGTLIVTHNSVVAIPLFTNPQVKEVVFTGPQTLVEVQTLLGCFGNEEILPLLSDASMAGNGLIKLGPGNNTLVQPIENEGPFTSAEILDVGTLIIGMSFDVPQNTFTYIPGNFCYGYRTEEGKWFFDFTPRDPFFSEGTGLGTLAMDANGIDMIAILFDKTTPVTFISYEGSNLNYVE